MSEGLNGPPSRPPVPAHYTRPAPVYARTVLDGRGRFQTPEDRQREDVVAALVARAWRVQMHRYAHYCSVDWWAEKDDRVHAVLELRSRTHAHHTYPTVYFSVQKWTALQMQSFGMNVPAYFLVYFATDDVLLGINLVDLPFPMTVTIGGPAYRLKSDQDREPCYEVPITALHPPRLMLKKLTDAEIDARIARYHDVACGYQIKLKAAEAQLAAVERDKERLALKVEQYQRQLDDRWAGVVGVTNEAVVKIAALQARVAALTAALRQAHLATCATVRPDGTCLGCRISAALDAAGGA